MSRLFPLYLVIFFGFVGYSLMITLFTPMFLSGDYILPANTSLSTRTILLGIVLFLYPFAQFLSSPVLGALSDRFGRRPILLLSLGLTTAFYLLTSFAIEIRNLPLLCISLAIAGFSEGNVTVAQSTIADVSTGPNKNRYFGYIYLSASLAYVIGPLFGGKLADPKLVTWFSYALPFWVSSALLFCVLLWILIGFKETHLSSARVELNFLEAFTNIKNIFKMRRLRAIFFINFLLYLAIFGFFRTYPMYLVDEFKLGVSKLSEFVAWVAFPIIIVNAGLTGFFAKHFSSWMLTLVTAIGVGVFLEWIVLIEHIEYMWFALFFAGFAIAVCLPSCAAFLSERASGKEQGRVMGNNQSLQFFAEASSGLLAGLLAAVLIKLALIIFGIVSFVGAAILFFQKEHESV